VVVVAPAQAVRVVSAAQARAVLRVKGFLAMAILLGPWWHLATMSSEPVTQQSACATFACRTCRTWFVGEVPGCSFRYGPTGGATGPCASEMVSEVPEDVTVGRNTQPRTAHAPCLTQEPVDAFVSLGFLERSPVDRDCAESGSEFKPCHARSST
jgi:hypothetical protein